MNTHSTLPSFVDEYAVLEEKILAAMSSETLDFNSLALEIFDFQIRHNPAVASYAEQNGTLHPGSWVEIPPLPQAAFKLERVACFSADQTVRTFLTSGTTSGTRGAHAFYSLRLHEASVLKGWDRLVLPAHRRLILAPPPDAVPDSSLSYMLGLLANRPDDFFIDPVSGLDIDRLMQELDRTKPVALLGTALAFLHFFEKKPISRNWKLPIGSYAMETGGYKGTGRALGKSELLERFESEFGLAPGQVINEYGMTELSSQFYTRGLDQPHHGPPWVRARLIDPETGCEAGDGKVGRIALIDLANLGSCLAIQTQDLAIRSGDGFILLGRDPAATPRGCSLGADEILRRPK